MASGSGLYSVRFDQPVYFVQPGQSSVPVGILIDPAPEAGLFSYGVTLKFDSAMASVPDSSAVKVVPPLNFDGVRGAGANIQLAAGTASVKGSVDTSLPAGTAYSGSLIGVFEVKNQAPAGSSYLLELSLNRTLGPSESVFVDGKGQVLDSGLTFGTAQIIVQVPEPGMLSLVGIGSIGLLFSGWREGRVSNA